MTSLAPLREGEIIKHGTEKGALAPPKFASSKANFILQQAKNESAISLKAAAESIYCSKMQRVLKSCVLAQMH